jgi:hypothetical protein
VADQAFELAAAQISPVPEFHDLHLLELDRFTQCVRMTAEFSRSRWDTN